MRNLKLPSLLLAALLGASALHAQDEPEPAGRYRKYEPTARSFSCEIPSRGWHAFEEDSVQGYAVHILGPDSPTGTYRAGIDIHWVERGQSGYMDYKKAIDVQRRSDAAAERKATPVRLMRVAGMNARVFEVTETRLLPPDRLPAAPEVLHHYVAILPSGDSYFLIRLSSTRDSYLDHRDEFVRFLKHFRVLGYK